MKKLQGLQTYKSIAFSYEQIPLTHFIIYRFPFSFLNTLPSMNFWGKFMISPVFPADEIQSQKNRMISTSLKPPRCGQPLFSPFHWRSPLSEQKKDGTYRRTSSHSLFRKRERQIRR